MLRTSFWRDARALAAPGGTLLVNTLYAERPPMARLARALSEAGWSSVKQHVDRGLQVAGSEARRPDDVAAWRPRDNMIFEAVA